MGKSTDVYYITKAKSVTNVGTKTCSNLGGGNNCTLTSMYNIMVCFRAKGYSKIPSKQADLYAIIKTQAADLGYTAKKGLSVTKNNNLVTNTWRKGFKYSSGSGTNNYLWNNNTPISSVDNGKPIMFSLASGVYYDHTITVYGYKYYKNQRTGTVYSFLMIRDGWSNDIRYLAWDNTSQSYVGCMTSIKTP